MTKVKAKAKPKSKAKATVSTKTGSKTKKAKNSTVNSIKKAANKLLEKAAQKLAPPTPPAKKSAKKSKPAASKKPVAAAASPVNEKAPRTPRVKPAPVQAKPGLQKISEKAKARESAMIRAKKDALEIAARTASEERKRGRKPKLEDIGPEDGLSKLGKKWASLYRKSDENQTPTYNMRGVYEEKTPIQHKVLGWGYILSNKNDRLEVLFKDGIRFLISNYKS